MAFLYLVDDGAKLDTGTDEDGNFVLRFKAGDKVQELEDGEPYFVLRGRDPWCPDLVLQWVERAAKAMIPWAKIQSAMEVYRKIRVWGMDKGTHWPD